MMSCDMDRLRQFEENERSEVVKTFGGQPTQMIDMNSFTQLKEEK